MKYRLITGREARHAVLLRLNPNAVSAEIHSVSVKEREEKQHSVSPRAVIGADGESVQAESRITSD